MDKDDPGVYADCDLHLLICRIKVMKAFVPSLCPPHGLRKVNPPQAIEGVSLVQKDKH